MKAITVFMIIFVYSFAHAQFVETSFNAPCGNISGLAYAVYSGHVMVLDSLANRVYLIDDWTGTVFSIIDLPVCSSPPVGLASMDSLIYFSESGTALVHAVNFAGNPVAVYDFSDSGPVSISGLGAYEYGSYGYLYIMDKSDRSVYRQHIPIGSYPTEKLFTIEEDLEVRDIGCDLFAGVPIACSEVVDPVRLYYSGSSYCQVNSEECTDVYGVASVMGINRIFFNCGVSGKIYRYCPDMGGTEDTQNSSVSSLSVGVCPNPVSRRESVQVSVCSPSSGTLSIYSIDGRILERRVFSRGNSNLNISLPFTGIFYLVADNDKSTSYARIICIN
ncbi:MAG: T9SS type A sorting domain-containing protein [Candidatus Sabulitectum sp.]|nr:T9SS type A sorting domain-containing protein [Candidatus Sabulitectum sp.]